jgi:hypothetical protein
VIRFQQRQNHRSGKACDLKVKNNNHAANHRVGALCPCPPFTFLAQSTCDYFKYNHLSWAARLSHVSPIHADLFKTPIDGAAGIMSNNGEEILFDSSPSPLPLRILQRRAMTSTSSPPPLPTNPTNATMTSSVTASSASTTLTTSTSMPIPTDLPLPFDQSLSSNLSASCEQFFDTFLADPAFKNCTPLSLLLQVRRSSTCPKEIQIKFND